MCQDGKGLHVAFPLMHEQMVAQHCPDRSGKGISQPFFLKRGLTRGIMRKGILRKGIPRWDFSRQCILRQGILRRCIVRGFTRRDTQSHMVLTQFTTRNSCQFLFELKKAVVLLGIVQDNLQHHLLTSLTDTRIVVHCNVDAFLLYIVVFLHLLLSVIVSLVQSPMYLLDPFVPILFGYQLPGCRDGGNFSRRQQPKANLLVRSEAWHKAVA